MSEEIHVLRRSTTTKTFFSKIKIFKKFLLHYTSWNKANTISIRVCRCLGNTASFVKGVKKYPHYKHYWVKIKTSGRSKLISRTLLIYMDLGDKAQTCGFLSNCFCRKKRNVKKWSFLLSQKKYFYYCAKRK